MEFTTIQFGEIEYQTMQVQNKFLRLGFLIPALIIGWVQVFAHPMPNSKGGIHVGSTQLRIELNTPVDDLEIAFGKKIDLSNEHSKKEIANYYLSHFTVQDPLHSIWDIQFDTIYRSETSDSIVGNYKEFTASLLLTPSNKESLRNFEIKSDLIIHQIPNHSILFSIDQDWSNAIDASNVKEVGVISLDIPTGKIFPLQVKIEKGSWWKGFGNMFQLGMSHIKEGTDHLLFLLTLLIAACFVCFEGKWVGFGGPSYSLKNIIRIVTAFTIGHSITLILGTFQVLSFPQQPIEILIAISILVTAVHAIKPIFPEKEKLIAGIFGLIHGAAFASTLTELKLDGGTLALSLFGFNLGIEVMQLLIVLLCIPAIFLFCYSSSQNEFRIAGGVIASIAASGWLVQRISGKNNFISSLFDVITLHPMNTIITFTGIAFCTLLLSKALVKFKLT